MPIAVLNDIHGNLPALEAVLEDARRAGATEVVVGGDVLPGPLPRETLARLRALEVPVHVLRGNGENDVLAARRGDEIARVPEAFRDILRWTAAQLDDDDVRALERWPDVVRRPLDPSGMALFCHATPQSDVDIITRTTDARRLQPLFDGLGVGLVVCGHTHMQFDRMVGTTRVVNAGSVGMPFADPGAYWALIGSDVELRRTPYDLEAAAARIRATRYPRAEEFAERYICHPPSEAQMLAVFTAAELR